MHYRHGHGDANLSCSVAKCQCKLIQYDADTILVLVWVSCGDFLWVGHCSGPCWILLDGATLDGALPKALESLATLPEPPRRTIGVHFTCLDGVNGPKTPKTCLGDPYGRGLTAFDYLSL